MEVDRVKLINIAKRLKAGKEITPEEREYLVSGNKIVTETLQAELGEEYQQIVSNILTTREKLLRRSRIKKIQTTFDSDIGDVLIETRMFTPEERQKALECMALLDKVGEDVGNFDKALKGLRELCHEVDKTIDFAEFWDTEAGDDVIMAVVMNTLYGGVEAVGDGIKGFRPNSRGPINP